MKTLKPGDNLNCYIVDGNGQQSSSAIHALVVATKQSVYNLDGNYTCILCIVDESGGKLTDSNYAEAANLFQPPQERSFPIVWTALGPTIDRP